MEGKVLVVDDDSYVMESCGKILVPEGFLVRAVADGHEAMEIFYCDTYDVVFINYEKIHNDGSNLVRWLHRKYPDTCVLAIVHTGHEFIKTEGILDYIEQPFSLEMLLQTTKRAFYLSKQFAPSIKKEIKTAQ